MLKKKAKEPLLYIQQPSIQFPEAKMQELYSSPRKVKENQQPDLEEKLKNNDKDQAEKENKNEEAAIEQGTEVKNEDTMEALTDVQESIQAYEEQRAEADSGSAFTPIKRQAGVQSFNRVKRFREMNTLERLDYLENFPKQLPPVPCVFELEETSFRGILIGRTEEMIEIKQLNGKIQSIPMAELKGVKMTGLRG